MCTDKTCIPLTLNLKDYLHALGDTALPAIFLFQLCQHEGEERDLEKQLNMKVSEYDSLYVEHDEEVTALQQQKEQVMYQLEDMEERFQHLLSAHEKQVKQRTVDMHCHPKHFYIFIIFNSSSC